MQALNEGCSGWVKGALRYDFNLSAVHVKIARLPNRTAQTIRVSSKPASYCLFLAQNIAFSEGLGVQGCGA